MNQPSLFDNPRDRNFVLRKARDWCYEIPQKIGGKPFHEWLEVNYAIWERFRDSADRLWAAGRRHAGARRIGEWMRYETELREVNSEWKINDHCWPALARLYMHLWPEKTGFFELRDQDRKEAA